MRQYDSNDEDDEWNSIDNDDEHYEEHSTTSEIQDQGKGSRPPAATIYVPHTSNIK